MKLNSYLNFNGRCAEAFTFYEKTLGGKIAMSMTHGESPAKDFVSADWHDKIMHVRLDVGDQILMGSDAPPEHYQKPQGMVVSAHRRGPGRRRAHLQRAGRRRQGQRCRSRRHSGPPVSGWRSIGSASPGW